MKNKKIIAVIVIILFLAAFGCALAAWLFPLGKFQGIVVKFAIIAFLALIVFVAGLMKGR